MNVEDPVELETPVPQVTVTQSSPSVSDELLVEVPIVLVIHQNKLFDHLFQICRPGKFCLKRHCTAVQRYQPTV